MGTCGVNFSIAIHFILFYFIFFGGGTLEENFVPCFEVKLQEKNIWI
jgi:peptidoglycan biosynthesis protein MviN/MurJ (putative lipid II flippase)